MGSGSSKESADQAGTSEIPPIRLRPDTGRSRFLSRHGNPLHRLLSSSHKKPSRPLSGYNHPPGPSSRNQPSGSSSGYKPPARPRSSPESPLPGYKHSSRPSSSREQPSRPFSGHNRPPRPSSDNRPTHSPSGYKQRSRPLSSPDGSLYKHSSRPLPSHRQSSRPQSGHNYPLRPSSGHSPPPQSPSGRNQPSHPPSDQGRPLLGYKPTSRPSSSRKQHSRPGSGHNHPSRPSSSHDQPPQSTVYKQPSRPPPDQEKNSRPLSGHKHPSRSSLSHKQHPRFLPSQEQPPPPSRRVPGATRVPCAIPEEAGRHRRRRHELQRRDAPVPNRWNIDEACFDDQGSTWHGIIITGGLLRFRTIEWEWEIPDVLKLSLESRHPDISDGEWLEGLLIFAGNVGADGELRNLEATTCGRYMKRHWGRYVAELLQDITEYLESAGGTGPETYEIHDSEYVEYITIDKRTVSITLRPEATESETGTLLDAFNWLCKAVRLPGKEDTFGISTSVCHPTSCGKGSLMHVTLQTRPLPELEYNCWQRLFASCMIVESDGSKDEPESFGRGLEVSFELLVQLAAVQWPVYVDGGFVLVGYMTALVPTDMQGDCVQFHLEVSESGQINPYKLKAARQCWVEDHNQFKTMRCFVGWCEWVHINLGTRNLVTSVGWSGCQVQGTKAHWNGFSVGLQTLSSMPLQIFGQANFNIMSTRLNFPPTSDFAKMLLDTSKQQAIVFDAQERRAWLVPKLSLLLHMSHVWARRTLRGEPDPIPFVEPHYDGGQVATALMGSGDIIVWGRGNDSLTFRSLLLRLNINLQSSMEMADGNSSRSISGVEFMDVVEERGNGCKMRKIPVGSHGRSWVKTIVNEVDAVVVCSGLGLAITPADDGYRRSFGCNLLPAGFDYLVAPLSGLGRLSIRQGYELNGISQGGPIKISSCGSWSLSGDPFRTCPHYDESGTTCWDRTDIYQRFVRHGPLSAFRWGGRSASAVQNIPLHGAVVFN